MKNARLLVAIITNILDEGIIIALILWGLPRLGIHLPLYGLVLICVAFLVYAVGFYTVGSQILRKKPIPGFSDMVGTEGRAATRLTPGGFVKIGGELWEARTEIGIVEKGEYVIVADQIGLKLVVRRKPPSSPS
jgi:membrane-bound ClpP family serine protease